MNTHPTELELEQLLRDDVDPEVRQHVAGCPDRAELLERLRELERRIAGELPELTVPESVDDRMLALAGREAGRVRGELRERRNTRGAWRVLRWAGPMAAAAGVLFFVTVPMTLQRDAEPAAVVRAGDVNADGRLDIVDALLLARALEEQSTLEPGWDADGDRHVDRADVEHLARVAVSLGEVRP